jgi:hypothetical protein
MQHASRTPRNRLITTTAHKAEGTKEDLWRDFWTREAGTGQQVVQRLGCYMVMMMMMMMQ